MKLVPHSIVGSVREFEEGLSLKKGAASAFKYSAKLSSAFIPQLKKEEKFKKPNFEPVDDLKLNSIYKKFQNLKVVNEDKKNEFLNKVPERVTHNLKLQEMKLTKFKSDESRFNNLVKMIAKKTNKNEDEVLMTITDTKRIRKEYNELVDSKKPFEEKYGNLNWSLSLRRPKNFIGTRHSYVNLGNDYNPVWFDVKETVPTSVEIIRKPSPQTERERRNKPNSRYLFETIDSTNYNINRYEKIKDLKVGSISNFLAGRDGLT